MSSRFNAYMASHFAGCRLIAEGFDLCRDRAVQAFMLPGYHTDVGFTDGTDAWIVPLAAETCTGAGNLMKGINLRELMGRILNGEGPPVARVTGGSRRHIALDDEPTIRRRPTTESTQPQENTRRRHVTLG